MTHPPDNSFGPPGSGVASSISRRARWRFFLLLALRYLARAAVPLVLCAVFVTSVLVAALVHSNLPLSRRVVAAELSAYLTDFFEGSLSIESIERLTPQRVQARQVVVRDPAGNVVLEVAELRARARLLEIGRQLLLGQGKQTLIIDHVRADRVECMLLPEAESGRPSIAHAFTPVARRTGTQRNHREIRVWLGHIEIGDAWGRGTFRGLPTFEAELARIQGSVLATRRGAAVDVKRFGAVVRGLGGADASGTGELHIRAPGAVWTNFDGFMGDVGVDAFAYFKRDEVELRLDLPRVMPAAMRSVWKDWPLYDDVKLHIASRGKLSALDTQATMEVGPARIEARGQVRLAGDVGLQAVLDAEHLDLRSVVPSAPATDISARTRVDLFEGSDGIFLSINGTSRPATVGGVSVPATDVASDYRGGELKGVATLHEHGVPLKLEFRVGRDGAIQLDLDARTFSLQAAPRVRQYTTAQGVLQLQAKGQLLGGDIEASIDGSLEGFSWSSVSARSARVTGEVAGPLKDWRSLTVDGHVAANGVRIGELRFRSADLRATGPIREPQVVAHLRDDEGPSFDLSGHVDPDRPRVRALELAVERGGARIQGRIADLDLAAQSIRVKGVQLRGAGGSLDGSFTLRPHFLETRVAGRGIDLSAVGRILGIPAEELGGRVGIDADVSVGGDVSQGRVSLRIDDGRAPEVEGVNIDATAELNARRFVGQGDVSVGGLFASHVEWDTFLGTHALELAAWRDLVGSVDLRFEDVQLAEVQRRWPDVFPVEALAGTARASVSLSRRLSAALPSVNVTAVTNGLSITTAGSGDHSSGKTNQQATGTTIAGLDLQLGISANGETGYTLVNGTVFHDLEGLLVGSGRFQLDLQRLVQAPDAYRDVLLDAPAVVDLELRKRDLSRWPAWLRPSGIQGEVGASMHLAGTMHDPVLRVTGKGRGLTDATNEYARPVDILAAVDYQPESGDVGGVGEVRHQGRRVALINLSGNAPLATWFPARIAPEGRQWQGQAEVLFLDWPLGLVPALAKAGVEGKLKGALTLERTDEHPTARASLDVTGARVARASVGDGSVRLETSQDAVRADVRLGKGDGFLSVLADAGLAWEQDWPALDISRPVGIDVEARDFEAAVLGPFVREVLSEVRGKIDADLSGELTAEGTPSSVSAQSETGSQWRARWQGTARVHDAKVQVEGLGLDLYQLGFRVVVQPMGRQTQVQVLDLTAQGQSSNEQLMGRAELYLIGSEIRRGVATLTATDMSLPIGGIAMATVTTARDERDKARKIHEAITVRMERQPEQMRVDVDVPTLVARLPPSVTRAVISTADNPDITVRQPLRRPEAPRDKDAFPWQIVFHVGPRAHVEYDDFELNVSGEPEVRLGSHTTLDGYIDLDPGGALPVLGKLFRIESGRIWLDPKEPTNPRLNVTASWQSSDATVYLKVRGRWNHPDLTLESDPAYAEDQIWIILAGGSPDDPRGAQEGGGVQAAYQAAKSLGLGRLVGVSGLGVSPVTSEGQTQARITYRVSDRVRVEAIGGQESGIGSTATTDPSQDVSSERRFVGAGAIEYRINRNWSIRTEAGNTSAGLDLLWQYRY